MLNNLYLKEAVFVAKTCKLVTRQSVLLLIVYYLIATLAGLLEGSGMLMLVDVVTGHANLENKTSLIGILTSILRYFSIDPDLKIIFFFTILILLLRVFLTFLSQIIYYRDVQAWLSKKIRYACIDTLMNGDWEFLRNMTSGTYVGAVSDGVNKSAYYFNSLVLIFYSAINAFILIFFALSVSFEISLLFFLAGFPAFLALRAILKVQKLFAEKYTAATQKFFGNITENLNGMYHIKVEGRVDRYTSKSLSLQDEMTRNEKKYALTIAGAGGFMNFIPVFILFVFFGWTILKSNSFQDLIIFLASISIIGSRAYGHINTLVQSASGLSIYGSNFMPVIDLLKIPREKKKEYISEKILLIEVSGASYSYNESSGIRDLNVEIKIGEPLIIMGPSGAGKTTLANLISGLYLPGIGKINYFGDSGKAYSSAKFRPRLGYVTQDIHLFHGTVRENLSTSVLNTATDEELWFALKQSGSEDFILKLGGLDAPIAEAGRSLSGGQKRRLGIARVLAGKPDILILDEMTAGVDDVIKNELISTIKSISSSLIIIIITHEEIKINPAKYFYF